MIRYVEKVEGLDHVESMLLDELEEPTPLGELAERFVRSVVDAQPDTEEVAALLSPALAALVANGLVEVRAFSTWPCLWESGILVCADDLTIAGVGPDVWARSPAPREVLVAHATCEGIRWM